MSEDRYWMQQKEREQEVIHSSDIRELLCSVQTDNNRANRKNASVQV